MVEKNSRTKTTIILQDFSCTLDKLCVCGNSYSESEASFGQPWPPQEAKVKASERVFWRPLSGVWRPDRAYSGELCNTSGLTTHLWPLAASWGIYTALQSFSFFIHKLVYKLKLSGKIVRTLYYILLFMKIIQQQKRKFSIELLKTLKVFLTSTNSPDL